ncbi:MAG: DUF4097 family beta strand repeat-containing protein [Actinomycetota bacterium]
MEPRKFDVTGTLHLRLRMRSGDVHITQTDASGATVQVTGERDTDEISIEHDRTVSGDTRLQITQRKDGWGFRSRGVIIAITVPPGSIVDLGTGAGDVTVEGTVAELHLQSGSGDASVARVTGDARVRNASGDVRVGSVEGDLTVTTASGEIEVGSVGGKFEARTASGDIEVGATASSARAMSASGDVSIASAGADVSLRSVSGDIELGVPAGTRVWFDVSSTSGDTSSELDADEGTGDASMEIKATSVSGDIRIRRAPAREASTA